MKLKFNITLKVPKNESGLTQMITWASPFFINGLNCEGSLPGLSRRQVRQGSNEPVNTVGQHSSDKLTTEIKLQVDEMEADVELQLSRWNKQTKTKIYA